MYRFSGKTFLCRCDRTLLDAFTVHFSLSPAYSNPCAYAGAFAHHHLLCANFIGWSTGYLSVFWDYFDLRLPGSCLERNGRLTPPLISVSAISKNFGFFFKQIGLYALISFLEYQLYKTMLPYIGIEPSLTLMSIISYVILLLLPAMIIMLAVTKSLFAAIMPHAFILLAWRIGWPYLAMNFFLTLLISAPFFLLKFITDALPPHVLIFLAFFFATYYMIVSYHLMGYILFQYHERVGYNVAYEGDFHSVPESKSNIERTSLQSSGPGEDLLAKVNLLIRDGDYDTAVSEIRQATGGYIEDPVLADRYYSLLHLRKMTGELISFAPDYIRIMNKSNQKDKICAAYLFCSPIRPDFMDSDPKTLFIVGKMLYENGSYMDALKIFDRFVQIHPDHPMTPDAYFLIARIFNERLNNSARASKILEWLDKTYPFHDNAAFMQSYARQIKI